MENQYILAAALEVVVVLAPHARALAGGNGHPRASAGKTTARRPRPRQGDTQGRRRPPPASRKSAAGRQHERQQQRDARAWVTPVRPSRGANAGAAALLKSIYGKK